MCCLCYNQQCISKLFDALFLVLLSYQSYVTSPQIEYETYPRRSVNFAMLFKVDPYLQIILIKLVKSELTYDLKLQRCGGCTQNPQFNIFYNNLSSGSPWAIFVLNALFWYLIVIKYHQSFLEVLRGKQIKLNNKFILFLCFEFRYLPRVGVLSPMHIVLEYIRNSLDFCADWRKFLYYNPI